MAARNVINAYYLKRLLALKQERRWEKFPISAYSIIQSFTPLPSMAAKNKCTICTYQSYGIVFKAINDIFNLQLIALLLTA